MEKSSIKKELGKLLVNAAIKKIDIWANNQLKSIRNSRQTTIIVPLNKRSWIIGPYTLLKVKDNCFQLTLDKKVMGIFYSRQASVFYAALSKSNNIKYITVANDIKLLDESVGKLYDEMNFYSKKLKSSSQKITEFKRHLWQSRYSETVLQYKSARKELVKKLNHAKYIKVWDN